MSDFVFTAILCAALFGAFVCVCAVRLSAQISREEEQRECEKHIDRKGRK